MSHTLMADLALERYLNDPDGPGVLRDARQALREGRWPEEYVEAIGQHYELDAGSWPEEQVAAFIEAHMLIVGGSVAEVAVATRGKPLQDRDRAGNASLLEGLPHPFAAEVDLGQHMTEGDGRVNWSCPIRVSLSTGLIGRNADGTTWPLPVSFLIPPGSAVLEIGTTLPSRTWAHLTERSGKVARWPYGYSRIRLLVNLDLTTMMSHRAAKYMQEILSA